MNRKAIIFILIVILIFVILKSKEQFITYYGPANNIDSFRYCKSCEEKTTFECNNCINCGVCVTGNVSKCISGDQDGPENKSNKCEQWIYGDNNISNYVSTYVHPIYPYYYDIFYPPYYYDGLYYGRGSTYNSRPYFKNKHGNHDRHDKRNGGRDGSNRNRDEGKTNKK